MVSNEKQMEKCLFDPKNYQSESFSQHIGLNLLQDILRSNILDDLLKTKL